MIKPDVLLAAIAFRVTRILVRDTVFFPVRFKLGEKSQFLYEMLSCWWCAGTYVSLALTILSKPKSLLLFFGRWAILGTVTGLLGAVNDRLEQ